MTETRSQVTYESQALPPITEEPDPGGYFSYSGPIHVSSDRMIVGYQSLAGPDYNSATIYHKLEDLWIPDTVLYGSDDNIRFGEDVSISGEYAFVGDWRDSTLEYNNGSVSVYHLANGGWNFQYKLHPQETALSSNFGTHIVSTAEYLLISKDMYNGFSQMSEIYKLVEGTWQFQQYLGAIHSSTFHFANGKFLVEGQDETLNIPALSIYSYQLIDDVWTRIDTVPLNVEHVDYRLVADNNADEIAEIKKISPGLFRIYSATWNGSTWVRQDSIEMADNSIGLESAYDNGFLVTGFSGNQHATYSGKVRCFSHTENGWLDNGELQTNLLGYWDNLGRHVAMFDGQAFVSSTEMNVEQNYFDGAIYVFQLAGCDNPTACNYSPALVGDVSLCAYPGCTDPIACNYNSAACTGGECIMPDPGDSDCSGVINVQDLLAFMDAFGCIQNCDSFDLDGDGIVAVSDLYILMGMLEE